MNELPGSPGEKPFTDHFSGHAAAYAEFRPRYPHTLAAYLAQQSPGRAQAWDCGTGSGQAACELALEFARVLATDPSDQQLLHAVRHPRVTYEQARERSCSLPARSADLVTAAQAAHWFDLPAFFAEARRVLRPRGVIAIWCYGLIEERAPAAGARAGAFQAVLEAFYRDRVGAYWPPERVLVETGYTTVPFPFDPLPPPPRFAMEATLSLDQLLSYVGTWSAVVRCRAAEGIDPLPELARALAGVWPTPAEPRAFEWSIALRCGRVSDAHSG